MQLTMTKDNATKSLFTKIKQFFQGIKVNARIEEKCLMRIEVKIDDLNLLHWLLNQPDEVKTYWRDREKRFEMAGVGEADVVAGDVLPADTGKLFDRLKRYLHGKNPRLRYYGGLRFDTAKNPDSHWQKFGAYRFVVPLFEIYSDHQATYFACNFVFNPLKNVQQQFDFLVNGLNRLSWDIPEHFCTPPELVARNDCPNRKGWWENVQGALRMFAQNRLKKIVLARKTELEFSEPVNALEMLERLQKDNSAAYYFCFQPFKNYAFIGGTPERLYKRDHLAVFSEAVAGTVPRGKTPEEDEQLEKELLNSDKERREHLFVVESIRETFGKICSEVIEQKKILVMKLPRLQHLYAKIRGYLMPGMGDRELLQQLHPTPAVGGYPQTPARREIARLENFDRGWYAGPVGWYSPAESEFAVAIRSGLAAENKLFLYSGAGIVPGSKPEKEWAEIENKISNFLKALECDV